MITVQCSKCERPQQFSVGFNESESEHYCKVTCYCGFTYGVLFIKESKYEPARDRFGNLDRC